MYTITSPTQKNNLSNILNENDTITYTAIQNAISNQVRIQQLHEHMQTCEKGLLGKTGCQMCFGQWEQNTTHPILLKPLEEQLSEASLNDHNFNATDDETSSNDESDAQNIPDDHTDNGIDLPFKDELSHEYVQGYCIVDPILRDPAHKLHLCMQ